MSGSRPEGTVDDWDDWNVRDRAVLARLLVG